MNKNKVGISFLKLLFGLLVGYLTAGTIYKFYLDIPWSEALSKKGLLIGFIIFVISLIIISFRNKNK